MTIVNPLSSPAVIAQTATASATTPEERQVDLRMEQIVRATVVEGGFDKALLELDHRHYRAQSDQELQVGQKLTLQVLQTHPRLEFRVLNDQLGGRLSQLLPLLSRPYAWTQLVSQLQQQPQVQLSPEVGQIYNQLQQLLQPGGRLPQGMNPEVVRLAGLLQQLAGPLPTAGDLSSFNLSATPVEGMVAQSSAGQQPELIVNTLLRDLQQQLQQLPKDPAQPLPQKWIIKTQNILLPLQRSGFIEQLPPQQLRELTTLLGQIRPQQLPQPFVAELGRLVAQLQPNQQQSLPTQPAVPAATSAAVPGAQVVPPVAGQSSPPLVVPPSASGAPVAPPVVGQSSPPQVALLGGVPAEHQPAAYKNPLAVQQSTVSPAVVPKEVSTELEQLLVQVKQLQGEKGALPPDLNGRLEGLLNKLHQLPKQATAEIAVLPGLELLSSQLTQIVQSGVLRPEGGQLGFLSQLFGFHLEAELLKGKKKEALASLKLSLLTLRENLGKQGEEPLQRLELLQMCKAKLAQDEVQFLPLLFPELEEGYLFVEKQREQEEEQDAAPPLQLSVSLRVSALGNMRIDMLYDKQGLHLRMACEDKEKMKYVQGCSDELKKSVETVPLKGVSFGDDAQVPTRSLQERLLPEALGILNARI